MSTINGIDFVVQIGTQTIGGQQGATLNRSKETIDATHKGSNGWKQVVAGMKEWGIEADGLIVMNDAAFAALETAFLNDAPVQVSIGAGNMRYQGSAIITDFPLEAGYEDLATYSVTFEGTGPLTSGN